MNDFDIGVQTRSCSEALLILDMISDFEFEDGDKLYAQALAAAERIARLKKKSEGRRRGGCLRKRQLRPLE